MSNQLQPASQQIYEMKYKLKEEDANLSGTFYRVADALSKNEKDREIWRGKFIYAMENGAIPAGRIVSNAGAENYKPNTSVINCAVIKSPQDSIEGIMATAKDAAISLSKGIGIGYCFSSLRPKGSYINGVGAETSGSLSFMEIFNTACFTINSAGGRRGAQMATHYCFHPDIEAFITSKQEHGRFRQFNLSVLITDEFIHAIENNSDWDLYFPIHKLEYAKISRSSINTSWKDFPFEDDNYITDTEGKTLCKIYKTMKATELWDLILKSSYEFSEPGILLIDKINSENNLWFCENISAVNPCVIAGTKILTKQGYKCIEDLIDQHIDIWNGFEWSNVKPEVTGKDQEVLAISFSNGMNLTCTKYHGFLLKDEQSVEAKDLKVGDKLMKFNFPVISGELDIDIKESYTQGFYSGDGSSGRDELWLYGDKIDLIPHLSVKNIWRDSKIDRVSTKLTFIPKDKTYVPLDNTSINGKLAWLAGLMDSDGGRSSREGGVSIHSINKEFLNSVNLLLNTLGVSGTVSTSNKSGNKNFPDGKGGIKQYEVKECFRLSISPYSILSLFELGLTTYRVDLTCEPARNAGRFITVMSIEDAGIADKVYCFNEPKRHTAIFNGIMTSQCGEQSLPANGACLLGSINLTKFVVNEFTDSASFDFRKFEEVVRIFVRLLDNVVELNGLPLEEQRNEILTKRRHGMGFFGLGSALTMLEIKYGSQASFDFVKEISKSLALNNYHVGLELALEKGKAPIFDILVKNNFKIKNKFDSLSLLVKNDILLTYPDFDENSEYLDPKILWSISDYMLKFRYHFKDLWLRLLKHGCRFSHATTVPPTGTTALSIGNNASNGIEPSFLHNYKRNVIIKNKKSKDQIDVYSYELLKYKEEFPNSTKLPDYFVTADSISALEHVKMVASSQVWIDSNISKTVNCPTDISFENFKQIYKYAIDSGCKGCATFRFNPKIFSGVLVDEENLKNTKYKFKLENNKEIVVNGNDIINYENEEHVASNLFDAIKEGYYGKF